MPLCRLVQVDGDIPEGLRGTLLMVGPALTNAYGTEVHNPADGDGAIVSLAFDGRGNSGKVFFRNRFVRTSSFQAEQVRGGGAGGMKNQAGVWTTARCRRDGEGVED